MKWMLPPVLLITSCVVYPGYPHEVSFAPDDTIWHEEIPGGDPPPLRTEILTQAPSPLHVWIPGYWWWDSRWIWVDGCWKVPPNPKHIWLTGRWERRDGRWIWTRGRWEA